MKVLHSIGQQIWKTQQWPQDWKRSVFIPISKKINTKIRLIIFYAAKDGEALYINIFTVKQTVVPDFDICAEIAGGE